MVEVNDAVSSDPALINQAAEGEGWLFKLKLSDEGQLTGLLDKAGYDKLVG
ncbi:Glycine cleavage system H protein [compost metagenome]